MRFGKRRVTVIAKNEALLIKQIGDVVRSSARGTKEQNAANVAEKVAIFVNESDPHWISPPHDAVEGGERECVAALLAAGARVDAQDENGATPLALARPRQRNHLIPKLTASLERQIAVDAAAATMDTATTGGAERSKDVGVKSQSIAVTPATTGAVTPTLEATTKAIPRRFRSHHAMHGCRAKASGPHRCAPS